MIDRRAVERGTEAFERDAWGHAHRELAGAHAKQPLEPADLERLAVAAYLIGKETEAIRHWQALTTELASAGEPERAARWGFWISLVSLFSGERAQSAGWLSRTQRLLKGHAGCAEQGLLLILEGLFRMGEGNADDALEAFEQAASIVDRFPDDDLLAFSLLSRGQALIQQGRAAEGTPLLDEAMVTVLGGAVSPMASGVVYCAAILTSQRIFDLERAREWTAALGEWCAANPDLVQFRGQCLVHRSEVLALQGDWQIAMHEAQRARDWYAQRTERLSGRASYQLGELHRLRGDFPAAEEMYAEASRNGMEPQPGLSLLRLAQGEVDAAVAAVRRVAGESSDRQGPRGGTARAEVLGPYVEIMLASGDLDAARAGADELSAVAAAMDVPLLHARAAQWSGAVLLAEGKTRDALPLLRKAWSLWQQLCVAYESARVQLLIGRTCEELGDRDTADNHRRAASAVLERLGARPALSPTGGGTTSASPDAASALTRRERQVLVHVARGNTNRQIAAALHISEHTVARHLSNIFTKLDVGSRTAAAAFALEHGLA